MANNACHSIYLVALVHLLSSVSCPFLLQGVVSSEPSYWQCQWSRLKRMMFEAVVEEPLVILVKLADRLHNMRTVYALSPDKQQAVAEETLAVWCSMAASLGWHRLKVGGVCLDDVLLVVCDDVLLVACDDDGE